LNIDSQSVTLHPAGNVSTFSITLPGGHTYFYNASAGAKYTSISDGQVAGTSGQTTELNITLTKTTGTLSGGLALPPGADVAATVVTVNGTAVPVNAGTLSFSLPETWGYYWVNATNPLTTSFAPSQPVVVNPGLPTTVHIALSGGWIQGNVIASPAKYTGLVVTVNGSSNDVSLTGGAYNYSCDPNLGCPGGWYWVNATEPGYNTTSAYVHLVPGTTVPLNLHLTNDRVLSGLITPLSVATNAKALALSVEILNRTDSIVLYASGISATTGLFNQTVTGGVAYDIIATATGYNTTTVKVPAYAAGATSPLVTIQLNKSTSVGPGQNNTCPNASNPNCPSTGTGTTSSSGISTDVLVGIGIVVLLAIVAIAVLLMRRRGDSGGSSDTTTDSTNTGDAGSEGTYGSTPGTQAPTNDWSESPPPAK
jgi:hypothetical protein